VATGPEHGGPPGKRRANPFDGELARTNSAYASFTGGGLVREPSGSPVTLLEEFVHDSFRGHVLNPRFSCVGAKAAVRRGQYRTGLYGTMGSRGTVAGLARDLFEFVEDLPHIGDDFTTFVASFGGPHVADEVNFERLLWTQLQGLYDQDQLHHDWDSSVSADPEDPDFSFSFAGRAFFVVGLHPASSRYARRFAWPTLVFNTHEQFERLREGGRFARVREVIRAREIELQGSLNPNLSDFGELPEARQYSGRLVDEGWRCPFATGQNASDEGGQR
jgi:FPC/CPF motif-containing protein YcgG